MAGCEQILAVKLRRIMKPVTLFRHIECEGPGYLDEVLKRHNIPVQLIAIDQGDAVPESPADSSGVIIMGGPMSVNDDDEWIQQETHFIRRAIDAGLPALGHCLGGQFIAKALGARIVQNPVKEIGWFDVERHHSDQQPNWIEAFSTPQPVFHWHGETFELPDGAVPLLKSRHCENQAFLYKDNVLAFQCHIEMTADMVDEWSSLYEDEITPSTDTIQSRAEMMSSADQHIKQLNRLSDQVYDNWINLLEK